MRIHTVQFIVGLLSAIAFVIAFMAAGAAIVSSLFALVGAVLLAWVVYSLARRALTQRAERNVTPT